MHAVFIWKKQKIYKFLERKERKLDFPLFFY